MDKFPVTKIDLNKPEHASKIEPEYSNSPAAVAMELGALAMKFSRVERVPRYDKKTRENDAEHSYMLSLVAPELAVKLYPKHLNPGLVSQFAVVHDLIEVKTGDKATFHYSADDMAEKQHIEHAALHELLQELPPYTAWLLSEYEEQKRLEARFTRAIDKLLPVIVDILGAGKKVMVEDYGVNTLHELEESHAKLHGRIAESFKEFPDIVSAHRLLCELFELEFDVTQKC